MMKKAKSMKNQQKMKKKYKFWNSRVDMRPNLKLLDLWPCLLVIKLSPEPIVKAK